MYGSTLTVSLYSPCTSGWGLKIMSFFKCCTQPILYGILIPVCVFVCVCLFDCYRSIVSDVQEWQPASCTHPLSLLSWQSTCLRQRPSTDLPLSPRCMRPSTDCVQTHTHKLRHSNPPPVTPLVQGSLPPLQSTLSLTASQTGPATAAAPEARAVPYTTQWKGDKRQKGGKAGLHKRQYNKTTEVVTRKDRRLPGHKQYFGNWHCAETATEAGCHPLPPFSHKGYGKKRK